MSVEIDLDARSEEARIAAALLEVAKFARRHFRQDLEFGILVVVPGATPDAPAGVMAHTTNRLRVATGAAEWALTVLPETR